MNVSALRLSSFQAKILAVGVFILLLIIFNVSGPPRHDVPFSDYDLWLQDVELKNQSGFGAELPSVELRIQKRDGQLVDLHLEGKEKAEQIFRILQLAKEADLFSPRWKLFGSHSGPITVIVDGKGKRFVASFNEDDLGGNSPAQVLLKLFEVYAQNSRGSVQQ